jgi:VanZ family protein
MIHIISPKTHATIGWVMVLAVIVLSLVPAAELPEITSGYDDKLAHGLTYAVLAAWFAIAAVRSHWNRIALWVFALGSALECCQALVPYRTASLGDIFANSAGIIIGIAFAFALTTGSSRSGRAK